MASAFIPGLCIKSQLLSGDAGHKESCSFMQATSWRTCDASASGKNLGPDREQGHRDPVLTVCKADGGADRQNTERGGAWSRVERNPVKAGLERKHAKGAGESLSTVERGACPKRAFAKFKRACSWSGVRWRSEVDRAGFRRIQKGQGAI